MDMKAVPIILDTDIGDDVDDALALAIILNSPELDLRGITTVFRDAPRRAQLTEHLLNFWQRTGIPVVPGASKPLLQPFDATLGKQFEVLPDTAEYSRAAELASEFLIRMVRETEVRLTLVPIGPLTNIALALARWPELAKRCRIIMMGGAWDPDSEFYQAEWNIFCDPESAAMVFNSGAKIHMIGLDVTRRCVLSKAQVAQIKNHNSPRAGVLSQMVELWMQQTQLAPILHDPLAILTLFDECVQFEQKKIEVQLCGEERGKMRVLEGAPNAHVAVDVDAQRAVELFMARVLL
jgi:inosine-uridine nucleoside N-ribohydrolase